MHFTKQTGDPTSGLPVVGFDKKMQIALIHIVDDVPAISIYQILIVVDLFLNVKGKVSIKKSEGAFLSGESQCWPWLIGTTLLSLLKD